MRKSWIKIKRTEEEIKEEKKGVLKKELGTYCQATEIER